MKTLELFYKDLKSISTVTTWYIADLAEYRGKQELYIHQAPQKLKTLREHAIIESSISSNRLEGIEIEQKRIGTVIFGNPLYTDRNEEEVAGYRKALTLIHENHGDLPICEQTIKKLHALTRGEIWDAGKYKEKNSDIIEKSPERNLVPKLGLI